MSKNRPGSRPKVAVVSTDSVTRLPGYGRVDEAQFAGYASIRRGSGVQGAQEVDEGLFYWFVGAKDHAHKPTVLWTNGGPGSSSFWGFFLENGPYSVDAKGKTLSRRAHAWNNHANYMIFEHPLSVTLSVAQQVTDIPQTVEQGIAQLYQALLNFVELHPEVGRNPLVLAGESYAGTYLPLLAQAIVEGNRTGRTKLDLKLMVLCDAWVNPMVQMATVTTWAMTHGLITAAQKQWLDETYRDRLPQINAAIQELCGCYMTNTAQTADPPFSPILDYLNDPAVREALHVPAHYPKVTENWSKTISKNYAPRVNESYAHVVQALLDDKSNVKVRVVSGLNDAKDCNFLGTGAWLDLLQGEAAYAFQAARPEPWRDEQKNVLGFRQGTAQLGWLKVLNAGHMAARDQPHLIHYILDALER
jgi:vitellogenic carboxypeptidase-like protein